MIVYKKTKEGFLSDVEIDVIEDVVKVAVQARIKRKVGDSEYNSWRNSLQHMANIVRDEAIPSDAGIAIEYNIPRTGNRIDFLISGQDEHGAEHVVIVELKQWSEVLPTEKDATVVVSKYRNGRAEEKVHPSYQAWSYAMLLNGFNETVYLENIELKPCAYLHNYTNDGGITGEFYEDYLIKAPLFCKEDKRELRDFITSFVKHGDKKDAILRIEKGKIKPSKVLSDSVARMLKGNEEFIMIDEQKVVLESCIALALRSTPSKKNILVVRGGPGTGKSVVAINLLVDLTKKGFLTQYVTKNSAPRTVYESKLTGSFKKSAISNFFTGSGSFTSTKANTFDALIVDEAHRLNEKSGLFQNLGENQIKEIINASKFSVFFLDEDQKVTLSDIGSEEEIRKWAEYFGGSIQYMDLTSQFRCNGSDGYIAWLDNALQIRETANTTLEDSNYDFKVFDDPNELRKVILEKNRNTNKSRMVAGYCWDWASKRDPEAMDVIIPEFGFEMQWNLDKDGMLWIVKPESVNEIGCIHTCQGLELDFIGVVVGRDLVFRQGQIVTDPSARSKMDKSVHGYKKKLMVSPEETSKKLDCIIKNTYRTLMTRGMKGCYVYFVDQETSEYFRLIAKN